MYVSIQDLAGEGFIARGKRMQKYAES